MPTLTLKPTHKAVTACYDSLAKFAKPGIKYETAVRSAFQELLEHCAPQPHSLLSPLDGQARPRNLMRQR